ncbi:hypothetical protein EON77_05375, partial [bacterium]
MLWWSLLLTGWLLLLVTATLRPYRGSGEPILLLGIGLLALYPAYRVFESGNRTKTDVRRIEREEADPEEQNRLARSSVRSKRR